MIQIDNEQYLTTLLQRPIFPHERAQWLAEVEHHARLAGVTVTIHDVNLSNNTHLTTTIKAGVRATAMQT
jgi:hypothetical protein